MDNITRTILLLIEKKIIPNSGLFSISQEMIDRYIEFYSLFTTKGNGKFNKSFAAKLAGLTFVKINRERGGTASTIKEGMVYIISNPAWEDYFKVGMTLDLKERLKSYQTYSPKRDYKYHKYAFVFNRREVEKELLSVVPNYENEWLDVKYKTQVLNIMNKHLM